VPELVLPELVLPELEVFTYCSHGPPRTTIRSDGADEGGDVGVGAGAGASDGE
jgi:hypothetical protein